MVARAVHDYTIRTVHVLVDNRHKPAYEKVVFVKSDQQGKYEVVLPPAIDWIGPKAKALDPVHYRPRAIVFSGKVAVVKKGGVTLDLAELID
jgi:hypothetical protein